jgi:hypothetical protein
VPKHDQSIIQNTYLLTAGEITKCKPSTNLPALDHTVHQLNSRSPPSWDRAPPPGKESRLRLRLQGRQHIHIQQEEALPEISTLTAHRPSFPTCLFHPRRVHLLCHLDSPSVVSLPYLGLQEQAGPEFSGLYGSYRNFSQEFSSPSAHSLTWSRFTGQQAPRSPALRGHNNPRKTQTSAFQNGSVVTG